MRISDFTLVHSASSSPDLKLEDEDIIMLDSEGGATASVSSARPVPQQPSAGSRLPPMPVTETTIPAVASTRDAYDSEDEDDEEKGDEEGEEGEEEGEIHTTGSSGPGYPLFGDPKRLSSPARHTPVLGLRTASALPIPTSAPEVTTERDHHELRKDVSRVPDAALRGDRHRFNTLGGRDVDVDSDSDSSAHANEEMIDRTGEISVNIVAGTETTTVEFLLPSDGDDSEDVLTKCKVTVTTTGPGSVSFSASWRIGS